MYPIDRRRLAVHVYSLFKSLRKTATILKMSHSSIGRWLKSPEQKKYTLRNKTPKASLIVETIRISLQNDPFLSLRSLCTIVQDVFNFTVSRELVRTAIKKCGLTRKKARYFSRPKNLDDKIKIFVNERQELVDEGYNVFSLDETSFGRHGKQMMGYKEKGTQLRIQRNQPRISTVSSLVVATQNGIIKRFEKQGSFNTKDLGKYI